MSQGRPPSSAATPHSLVAPVAPAAVHQLATPTPLLVDAALPGYLLPAALSALAESSAYALDRKIADEAEAEGETVDKEGKRDITEAVAKRTERIGLMVGGFVAEKLTLARPPLASHLDLIKFICKDLFLYVYGKQIDNLRTNHRGIYVLQSHYFPPLLNLSGCSASPTSPSVAEVAKAHLVFPQAVVQGALVRLGMPCTVTAESAQLPQCTFQIRTVKSQHQERRGSFVGSVAPQSPR